VDALLLAAVDDKAVGKVYNLGSSEVVSLKDLAARLTALQADGRYEIVPFPPERKAIDIGDYYSEFKLIRDDLGWCPQGELGDGLQRTVDYYRSHGHHYWDKSA